MRMVPSTIPPEHYCENQFITRGKYTITTVFSENGPPLVVPKIVCSLFTSHNFDHCANTHSLHRPQGAVVLLALPPS